MGKNSGSKNGAYKHGLSRTRMFGIWANMLYRCEKVGSQSYFRYGAKGISVCNEWHDFINFYNWSIINNYNEELTIDRIDEKGNYEPSNCQWITRAENTAKANKTKQHRRANKGMYYGISPIGDYYEFINANVFAKENNLYAGCVRQVANGEKKTHFKWTFGFTCEC